MDAKVQGKTAVGDVKQDARTRISAPRGAGDTMKRGADKGKLRIIVATDGGFRPGRTDGRWGKRKFEVFTGLSVGVAWPVYDALFVCYLPLCHISIEKKKRKKVGTRFGDRCGQGCGCEKWPQPTMYWLVTGMYHDRFTQGFTPSNKVPPVS